MTEAEAKTKWCPFARVLSVEATSSFNRIIPSQGNAESRLQLETNLSRCIGSACMAWRGFKTLEFSAKADAEFQRSGQRLVSDDGFCGLAGKP